MINTIKFKLNDKPVELKVDGERRLKNMGQPPFI
jgi:hypothetical protein